MEANGCPVFYQMLATSMTRKHGNVHNNLPSNGNRGRDCKDYDFDAEEVDRSLAPLHFGCQICNGDQVIRNMRINNASPCGLLVF